MSNLEIENIVEEFNNLPKIIIESTYLEICKYPKSRFEEVCSRILCFYFDPTNEHSFSDLFIESLLQIIEPDHDIKYKNNQVEVINELNSEGKRLDILIKSPNMIIGIENKIYASVYNPLELYSNQINLYGKTNIFKVILTVKEITDKKEKLYIQNNGFVVVSYTNFFNQIKSNIGNYISQSNQKYLTFVYDFITTIENMTGATFDNNKLSHFFSANSASIDNLIELYNKFNQRNLKLQQEKIAELQISIISKTNDKDWWNWEGWDLGHNSFNRGTKLPKIGLESSFKSENNNPLGKFKIFITTWNIKDFVPYEDELLKIFPNKFLDKTKDNRVYLHVETLENADENLIIEKLEYYYKALNELVSKINV